MHSNEMVLIKQDTKMVDGLGGEVWPGAIVLCRYLEQNSVVQGKRVVELGCGTGLCGIVCMKLGAKSVLLTDEYIDLALMNKVDDIQVSVLDWEKPSMVLDEWKTRFDIVLGSEVTQVDKCLHKDLVHMVDLLLADNGFALFSMDKCTFDCTGQCSVEKCTASHFGKLVKDGGLLIKLVKEVKLKEDRDVKELKGVRGKGWQFDNDDFHGIFRVSRR